LKKISSENLLNPSKNPAKLTGSCIDRSLGVDSENSIHTGLIHDTHMQNDIGAVTSGCTETNSKSYYNDSGVGSSSERSDDTPSEPGDSDFKSPRSENVLDFVFCSYLINASLPLGGQYHCSI
jgi:hypothetical protein